MTDPRELSLWASGPQEQVRLRERVRELEALALEGNGMRTEADTRAARDKMRDAVRRIEETLGTDADGLVGPQSALAALSWVLGDDPDEADLFDRALDLTDELLTDLRALDARGPA